MKHVKALLIKFALIMAVLLIVLTGFFNIQVENTFIIGVTLTIVAYILGDLGILRYSGDRDEYIKRNSAATTGDAAIGLLVIWFMGSAVLNVQEGIIEGAIISGFIIAIGEMFFHRYVNDKILFKENRARPIKRSI